MNITKKDYSRLIQRVPEYRAVFRLKKDFKKSNGRNDFMERKGTEVYVDHWGTVCVIGGGGRYSSDFLGVSYLEFVEYRDFNKNNRLA